MVSLNVGCGGSSWIVTNKIKDVNIDIEKPKNKIDNFVLADSHYLPFKNNVFSNVLCKDVIEHLDSPKKALIEMKRVYNNNGKIIIITPNVFFYTNILLAIYRSFKKNKIPYNPHFDHSITWTISEMLSLLKKCGFKDYDVSLIISRHKENRFIFRFLEYFIPYHLKYKHIKAEIIY